MPLVRRWFGNKGAAARKFLFLPNSFLNLKFPSMMVPIKFGTDGWRAIIAQEYTVDNVNRVAEGTALWLRQHKASSVVIGHDCRFGGKLFAETTARVMGAHGIKVYLAHGMVSTPMVSLGVVQHGADLGIVITASHNPPEYNGFKLKSRFGGPSVPSEVAEVEQLIPDQPRAVLPSLAEMEEGGLLSYSDLEEAYFVHVNTHFDMHALVSASGSLAYDAMYGAGQNVVRRILPNAHLIHCEENPSFMGQAPEPIHRNLSLLSSTLRQSDKLLVGLANDGDADRIGMYDEHGNFVDSNHILLLLLLYLHKHKGMSGKVVVTFSVTNKMRQLAEKYGLEFQQTKIGFKYIAEIMIHEDVLVGGEESGGLAVKGHIPERDGVWIGLLILEFMAKTGKSLSELIQDVYDEIGTFAFERDDLHLSEDKKQSVMKACSDGVYTAFGTYEIIRTEDLDGYKFFVSEDAWVMVRPSGTEPVLRVYAEARDSETARAMLNAAHKTLLA